MRESGESEDSLRRRMEAELDAERVVRCSFCRKHDWEVGRPVGSADGRAFLCDECEASAHALMTETPVPPPHRRSASRFGSIGGSCRITKHKGRDSRSRRI